MTDGSDRRRLGVGHLPVASGNGQRATGNGQRTAGGRRRQWRWHSAAEMPGKLFALAVANRFCGGRSQAFADIAKTGGAVEIKEEQLCDRFFYGCWVCPFPSSFFWPCSGTEL